MKIKHIIIAYSVFTMTLFSAAAENLTPDMLLRSALERDKTMQSLMTETGHQILQNRLEDYKNGFVISAGTEEEGTSLSNIGKTGMHLLNIQPFTEIMLPEDTGTSIKAAMPIIHNIEEKTIETSASVRLSQDINKLFGINKQETAKIVRRASADRDLQNRIETRLFALERKILENTRDLAVLRKNIIINATNLNEKESLLTNMLNAEMLARNGSSHLSRLMEIRSLEIETAELQIDYDVKLEDFYRLTGIKISEIPALPEISTPVLTDYPVFRDIKSAEIDVSLKKAELSDFNSSTPPQLNLNMEGRQEIKTGSRPEISAGFSSGFDNFNISLNGQWNTSDGGSITAGIKLNIDDKTRKNLNRQLYENNLEQAEINLEIIKQNVLETVRSIKTSADKLESAEKNLNASEAFIMKYLEEMEAKYRRGLIAELELTRAREQKISLEIDRDILNIDRYLLLNSIKTLIVEEG